jgi:hypothetical protein
VWGAGGSGANAPAWLREAFGGATGPMGSATPLTFGGSVPAAPTTMEGVAGMFGGGGLSMGQPVDPFGGVMAQQQMQQREQQRAEDEDFQARRRALLGGIGAMFA